MRLASASWIAWPRRPAGRWRWTGANKLAGASASFPHQIIGETQNFVSKCERGERRIDVIELRAFCAAFGISLKTFEGNLERRLPRG